MSEGRRPVDLRAAHEASEIIGYAYRIYARHFRVMFAIALTTMPLQMLSAVVAERVGGDAGEYASVPIQLAAVVVILIAICGLVRAVDDVTGGETPDFNRSLDAAFSRFGALLTTNLLSASLSVLSVLAIPYFLAKRRWGAACSVPYFAVRWIVAAPAVVIEGKRNWGALDASSRVVEGRWWRTLGIFVLIQLISLAPLIALSPLALLPTILATTGIALALALALPFIVAALTLLYYDLRARQEKVASPGEPVATSEGTDETKRDDVEP